MTQSESRDNAVKKYESMSLVDVLNGPLRHKYDIPNDIQLSAIVQQAIDGELNPSKVTMHLFCMWSDNRDNKHLEKCYNEVKKIPVEKDSRTYMIQRGINYRIQDRRFNT